MDLHSIWQHEQVPIHTTIRSEWFTNSQKTIWIRSKPIFFWPPSTERQKP